MAFGSTWKELRLRLGVTQQAVADALAEMGLPRISDKAVGRWERNNLPDPSALWEGLQHARIQHPDPEVGHVTIPRADFDRLVRVWIADHIWRARTRATRESGDGTDPDPAECGAGA